MISPFEIVVLVFLGVLVVYVSRLTGRLQQLERSTRTLLQSLTPSNRVRELAADPKTRIEAMRAFREEAGVDVRVAKAVVDSLADSRA